MAVDSIPSTTGSSTQYLVGRYYEKRGLERLVPRLRLYQLAERKPIPKGISNAIYFHKFTEITTAGANITEGVAPSITWLSTSTVSATLKQRGAWTKVSDILSLVSVEPLVEEAAAVFGEHAARTVDLEILYRLTNPTTDEESLERLNTAHLSTWITGKQGGLSTLFFSCQTGGAMTFAQFYSITSAAFTASTAGEYALNLKRINYAVETLRSNDADAYDDGYYAMVVHPKVIPDLLADDDFVRWNQYNNAQAGWKGEIGKIGGVRVMDSTLMPVTNSCISSGLAAMSLHLALVCGPRCFAVTEIEGGYKMLRKVPNEYDTSNPLNQWSTIGWKVTMAAAILDKKRGYFLASVIN